MRSALLPSLVVPPGGRLSAGSIHNSLVAPSRRQTAVVDLSLAEWIEPLGLVAIANFVEAQVRGEQVRVRFVSPHRPELARYLSRMRLGEVLADLDVAHDLPDVTAWNTGNRLVELRRFDGPKEPDALGEMLFARTQDNPRVATALHQSIAEVGANVLDHSGRDHGYVAAQTTYGDTVVQFAVGDSGRGVAAGFRPRREVSDEESLDLALQQGVSRTGETGHGRGLQRVRRLVTEMRGHVHMVSGSAYRTTLRRSASSGRSSESFAGTLVQGSFQVPPHPHPRLTP